MRHPAALWRPPLRIVREIDPQVIGRELFDGAIRPLDREHPLPRQLAQAELSHVRARGQAVQIGVPQREPAAFVGGDEHERGADHARLDAEALGEAAHEGGLSRSEISDERERCLGDRGASQAPAEGQGVFLGREGQLDHARVSDLRPGLRQGASALSARATSLAVHPSRRLALGCVRAAALAALQALWGDFREG